MKIIPSETAKKTANYWCTWCSQRKFLTPEQEAANQGGSMVRAALTEDLLFNSKQGLLSAYDFAGCRGDLIALLDDGWDVHNVNAGAAPDYANMFGSLVLDLEHFKSYAVQDNPAESLKRLNDKVQSLGYRGLGLWISPQMPHDYDEPHTLEDARRHWEERAKWCHYAGVKYWKIDWGRHANDAGYLRIMADACRKYAPELIIENAWVRPPVDLMPEERDEAWNNRMKYIKKILAFSDCFRTYDVIIEFEFTSTLSRVAQVFQNCPDKPDFPVLGVICVEHLSYIAAGTGTAQGWMYHERYHGTAPEQNNPKTVNHFFGSLAIDAAHRVFRWNRIAAPFSIFESENHVSEEYFTNSVEFNQEDWPGYKGVKSQTAPAVMSRNCPLPEVKSVRKDGARPFVTASKYPEGPLAVATLPHTLDTEHVNERIRADISVSGASADCPVGVFGIYNTLTVVFDRDITGKRVFAQDLLEEEARDCTDQVKIEGNKLILSGAWIDQAGLAAKSHADDSSDPGLVLLLK